MTPYNEEIKRRLERVYDTISTARISLHCIADQIYDRAYESTEKDQKEANRAIELINSAIEAANEAESYIEEAIR